MATPIVTFEARLRTIEDNFQNYDDLIIQFYDLRSDSWRDLKRSIVTTDGEFSFDINFADEDVRTNPDIDYVVTALDNNCFPTTRLILGEADEDGLTQVVAYADQIHNLNVEFTDRVNISYGTSMIMAGSNKIVRTTAIEGAEHLEYSIISVPRPRATNLLFPAIQAAFNDPALFSGYTPSGHTIDIRPIGEPDPAIRIAELEDQVAARDATILERDEDIVTLNGTITERDADIVTLNDTIVAKDAIITDRDASIVTLNNTIVERDADIVSLNDTIALRDATILERDEDIITLNGTIADRDATILERDEDIITLNTTISDQESEIGTLNTTITERDATIVTLNTDIETKDTRITELETEVDDILDRDATSANEIYSAIVSEVETTAESTSGRFSVSNLSLKLKTHVKNDEEGFKLQLIDSARAEYINDATISDLTIDIISKDPALEEGTPLVAPRVTGLTETAVHKKLALFGLKLKPIYQSVGEGDGLPVGQSFKQIPAAGEEINPGDLVTVVFAKSDSNFN